MKIFDTHAHYDWNEFDIDRDKIFTNYDNNDIYVTNIGIDITSCNKVIKYSEKYKNLYFSLGIHPMKVGENIDFNEIEQLAINNKDNDKFVAIGETGIDYHFDYPKELQIEYLKKHINLANKLNLPIIIHARESHDDVYKILKNNPVNKKGIMHCYSGNMKMVKKFLDMGFYISFGGSITKRDKYDEIIKYVPLNKLLIETDAPLMIPNQVKEKKRNESIYLKYVIEKIAKLKNIDIEDLTQILFENACKIYNIKRVDFYHNM